MTRTRLTPSFVPLVALLLSACGGEYRGPLQLTVLHAGGALPAVASVLARVTDADGQGVVGVSADELTLTEDGAPYDGLRFEDAAAMDLSLPVHLLVDTSQGVVDDGLIETVKDLSHALVDASGGRPVRVSTFAESVTRRAGLTTDVDELHAAIDDIGGADGALTDLYGAVIDALDDVEDRVTPGEGLQHGLLVVITDGGPGPTVLSVDDVLAARGDQAVLAIALGREADVGALEAVANLGVHSFRKEPAEALTVDWTEPLARLGGAVFRVSACSASRDGLRSLGLDFRRDNLRASWTGGLETGGFDDVAAFDAVTPLPEPIGTHAARVWGGHLYVAGGDWDGNVFYAPILADGRLGNWREGEAMPDASETRFEAAEGALYAVNGPLAWMSVLGDDGAPGPWEEVTSPGYSNVLRAHEGTLYSVSRERAWAASIAGGGAPGEWRASEPFPRGLDGYVGATVAGGRLVVVGAASEGSSFETIGFSAELAGDGTIGAWQPVPGFPHYMGYWLNVDGDGERVLVFPGDDADSEAILAAQVDGAVGSWSEAGRFTRPRRYYSTAVGEGYLWVHGGYTNGDRTTEGLFTGVDADGLLGLRCAP